MSTNCTIAIYDAPEKFRAITCFYDGYPAKTGAYLLKYYNTAERIEQLFTLGNLNSIGANISEETVSFLPGNDQSVCIPDDSDTPCQIHESLDIFFDLLNYPGLLNNYIYLFKDGIWYVDTPFEHRGWQPLDKEVERDVKAKKFRLEPECNSRLYIVCKKTLNSEPIDIGHSMLSVGHSVAIAFNKWDKEYAFSRWRYDSFRKIVCQASEKEFESVKRKLTELNIDFNVCGEVHFGSDAEIALVVFPLEKERTPKCLQFLQPWGR